MRNSTQIVSLAEDQSQDTGAVRRWFYPLLLLFGHVSTKNITRTYN